MRTAHTSHRMCVLMCEGWGTIAGVYMFIFMYIGTSAGGVQLSGEFIGGVRPPKGGFTGNGWRSAAQVNQHTVLRQVISDEDLIF